MSDVTLSDWQARELTRADQAQRMGLGGATMRAERRGHTALAAAGLIELRGTAMFQITNAGRKALVAYNSRRRESP